MTDHPTLSVDDAAAELGLSPGYVRSLCRAGKLTAHREPTPGQEDPWMITCDDRYTARLPETPAEIPPEDTSAGRIAEMIDRFDDFLSAQRALQPSPDEIEARRAREAERDRLLSRLDDLPEIQRLQQEVIALKEVNRRLLHNLHEAHAQLQQVATELQRERARTWWDRLRGDRS